MDVKNIRSWMCGAKDTEIAAVRNAAADELQERLTKCIQTSELALERGVEIRELLSIGEESEEVDLPKPKRRRRN